MRNFTDIGLFRTVSVLFANMDRYLMMLFLLFHYLSVEKKRNVE